MYHAWEPCASRVSIEVFLPERIAARCIDGEGNEVTVSTLVHDPSRRGGADRLQPAYRAQVRDR